MEDKNPRRLIPPGKRAEWESPNSARRGGPLGNLLPFAIVAISVAVWWNSKSDPPPPPAPSEPKPVVQKEKETPKAQNPAQPGARPRGPITGEDNSFLFAKKPAVPTPADPKRGTPNASAPANLNQPVQSKGLYEPVEKSGVTITDAFDKLRGKGNAVRPEPVVKVVDGKKVVRAEPSPPPPKQPAEVLQQFTNAIGLTFDNPPPGFTYQTYTLQVEGGTLHVLLGTAADGVSQFKAFNYDRQVDDQDVMDFAVGESKIPGDEWDSYVDPELKPKDGFSTQKLFISYYNNMLNLAGFFRRTGNNHSTLLLLSVPQNTNETALEAFYNSIKLR